MKPLLIFTWLAGLHAPAQSISINKTNLDKKIDSLFQFVQYQVTQGESNKIDRNADKLRCKQG